MFIDQNNVNLVQAEKTCQPELHQRISFTSSFFLLCLTLIIEMSGNSVDIVVW